MTPERKSQQRARLGGQYPRSREGLLQLVSACEKELESIAADQVELAILSQSTAWKMHVDSFEQDKMVLNTCIRAAVLLSRKLKEDIAGIGALGAMFASLLTKLTKDPESWMSYLDVLLHTNIHNPVSPFNRTGE